MGPGKVSKPEGRNPCCASQGLTDFVTLCQRELKALPTHLQCQGFDPGLPRCWTTMLTTTPWGTPVSIYCNGLQPNLAEGLDTGEL